MSNTFDYSNLTALITGASSGIGAAMAAALAQRGCSVILSARDAAKLEARAALLRQAYNVNVAVVTADLSQPNGALDLHTEIVRRGLPVDLLVNNAGFGLTGPFLSHALSEEEAQVQVNVTSLMALTHLFAPAMAERSRGGIINIASLAAFQPQFNSAVYAAGKSFVLLFSEALWLELARRSCACCLSGTGCYQLLRAHWFQAPTPSYLGGTGDIGDLATFRQEAGRPGSRNVGNPRPSLRP